jgi:pimeloyl-ACP methyl ester carboxylesterase
MVSISGSGYWTVRTARRDYLCRLQHMAVWAIHGAQDSISDPAAAEQNLERLGVSCQGEVRWTLYPDQGHLGAAATAYRDPELYTWLLRHSR